MHPPWGPRGGTGVHGAHGLPKGAPRKLDPGSLARRRGPLSRMDRRYEQNFHPGPPKGPMPPGGVQGGSFETMHDVGVLRFGFNKNCIEMHIQVVKRIRYWK